MLTINIRTMSAFKQVLGVDVAQNELVVTLGRLLADLSIELYAYKVFSNNEKGFLSLLTWTKKLIDPDIEVRFVMEATAPAARGSISPEVCLFSGWSWMQFKYCFTKQNQQLYQDFGG